MLAITAVERFLPQTSERSTCKILDTQLGEKTLNTRNLQLTLA